MERRREEEKGRKRGDEKRSKEYGVRRTSGWICRTILVEPL